MVYQMRDGKNNYRQSYQIKKLYVHPAYRGRSDRGFDFALGILDKPLGGKGFP